MNRRLALGAFALVALVALAGCTTIFGPGEPDEEAISKDLTYDWDTEANATIDVNGSRFIGVYRVQNQSEIELYRRDALGTEHPLEIEGLKFRHPNGTVTDLTAEDVELTRDRAIVDLPAESGKVAFTSPRQGKSFGVPTFVTGTYEVTLPESARVDVPILAQVSPGGYESTVENNRVTLGWEDVQSRSISIRYYLVRDLWLFGGLLGLAILIGIAGAIYYIRQIRELEERREEVGLDVDADDDPRDKGPPPGMR